MGKAPERSVHVPFIRPLDPSSQMFSAALRLPLFRCSIALSISKFHHPARHIQQSRCQAESSRVWGRFKGFGGLSVDRFRTAVSCGSRIQVLNDSLISFPSMKSSSTWRTTKRFGGLQGFTGKRSSQRSCKTLLDRRRASCVP